jgi:glutamate transport system substrate-binding protein
MVLGATAIVLGAALTACGAGNGSGSGGDSPVSVAKDASFPAGTTMAKLHKAGKITIGTKYDQPLFGLKGLDGKPKGFDVEIAKIVAGDLGISPDHIKWVKSPSKVREQYLQQGKVDMVVATYTIKDSRRERVSFAGPYYNAGQDIMVKKDNDKIKGPKSLKKLGVKVCSAKGSTSAENLRKYVKPDQLVLFDGYQKCASALSNGQVQAVSTDNAILLGLISKNKGKFKLVGNTFSDEPYGIGITKGDVKFCKFIDKSLKKAVKDGSYQAAWKKTAGKFVDKVPEMPKFDKCP